MIIEKISKDLKIKLSQVESAVKLIDEGNTIPFISRYRKEATGGLTDVELRDLFDKLTYLRNLEERKLEVIRLIEEQELMTEELRAQILEAQVLQRVEDLYKPYQKKKNTRASKAKEKGLEPLADIIWAMEIESGSIFDVATPFVNLEKGVENEKDAIAGALDIIAEIIGNDPEYNSLVREITFKKGQIVTEATNKEEASTYEMYYDYKEAAFKIPDHRVLAINRGEKEKKLKVKLRIESEEIIRLLRNSVIINEASIFVSSLEETVNDAYKRLMAPSIEREIRNTLTERAEKEAVKVFAKNTEKLLMIPPVKDARVLSIDPGFRTGCKVTMLDETGKLLAYTTIYPTEPRCDIEGSKRILKDYIGKYDANVIAIGNGTASRETETFVSDMILELDKDVQYTIVNEAGASIYSASKIATMEYPDLDVTTRGAMSIGKRLQDPLAELVKISPKHIGVGQYQHDINQTLLDGALTNVVEDCVNRVGVDLNTASLSLLQYISGINAAIAKNIVDYRETNGKFKSRNELKKVAKLGEKTFNQSAGFLRISDGINPLDATSVHPESYSAAEKMIKKLGLNKEEIQKGGISDIEERINGLFANTVSGDTQETVKYKMSIDKLAEEFKIGAITLSDIVGEIKKPGRDPRGVMPQVVFRRDVVSFEQLKVDMELTGTVRNVVDFGAFVDIGVKTDGLVHISQICNRFIKHPMEVLSIGDTVKVKILEIDHNKKKVSLTMKI
jgi:protein Tex